MNPFFTNVLLISFEMLQLKSKIAKKTNCNVIIFFSDNNSETIISVSDEMINNLVVPK